MPKSKQGEAYTVYMHTTPNGKRYIGITAQTVERRWQNGYGYAYGGNDYFFNLPYAQISAVCKGKRKSTYGRYFRYKEE